MQHKILCVFEMMFLAISFGLACYNVVSADNVNLFFITTILFVMSNMVKFLRIGLKVTASKTIEDYKSFIYFFIASLVFVLGLEAVVRFVYDISISHIANIESIKISAIFIYSAVFIGNMFQTFKEYHNSTVQQ